MKKLVLLTGSRGFTGRYVYEALKRDGFNVVGMVQNNPQPNEVKADLLNISSLRNAIAQTQPHYVIHLAAIAFVAHSSAEAFYNVNLFGTLNLLEALHAEKAPVEKVLLASSASIYGNPSVSKISEDEPPAPINHYAMSKLAMEHMARTWLDRLPIIFTRPFNYTGIGQDPNFLIPKIIDHFSRRVNIIQLGNLDVVREFNDVRMIAQAYSGLIQTAKPNSVFNLCTGSGHSLKSILSLCEDLTNHQIQIEVKPRLARANELKTLIGDPTKLNLQLPNLPTYSLQQTISWMLNPSL